MGAISTILTGAATVIIWKQLSGGVYDLYELLPGFVFALIAGVIFSKIFPTSTECKEEFLQFQSKI